MGDLKRTPLHGLHTELGAKMVAFAGYEMPVQFPMGVMREHVACRSGAGLFDVSHMGQIVLTHADGPAAAAAALERLVPQSVIGLKEGRQRYALFLSGNGGILDDFMVARRAGDLFLVVNAARKEADLAHLREGLPGCDLEKLDRALLALQGPRAEAVLEALAPGTAAMRFMDVAVLGSEHGELWVSRSGYTGEDGYEISVAAEAAEALARALLDAEGVVPVGLGARDSLRLEAGLCLHGQDIDEHTSPVEADLPVVDPEGPTEGRRARGRLSWRRAGPSRDRGGADAAARRAPAGGARPDARGGGAVRRRKGGGTHHVGRIRPHARAADRDGLRRC